MLRREIEGTHKRPRFAQTSAQRSGVDNEWIPDPCKSGRAKSSRTGSNNDKPGQSRSRKLSRYHRVDSLDEVLRAIEAATNAGLSPVKVNAVIVRGRNDHEIARACALCQRARHPHAVHRIHALDSGHGWNREMVVPGREIYSAIDKAYPLRLKSPTRGNETAWKYEFADAARGEIGIIAPVTEMFCGTVFANSTDR
jgi:cyclic pyranopterin phosphate synthase